MGALDLSLSIGRISSFCLPNGVKTPLGHFNLHLLQNFFNIEFQKFIRMNIKGI